MDSSVYMTMYQIYSVVLSDIRTCIYSFEAFHFVNFNVSSTKIMYMLNFLDTFSVGVTFGIRVGRFRSCHGSLDFN